MSVFPHAGRWKEKTGKGEHLKSEPETRNYIIAEIKCKLISQGSVSSSKPLKKGEEVTCKEDCEGCWILQIASLNKYY